MMMPAALRDIRVLDISQGIAGPLSAKILGDFGADVIKVEPPGGEAGRTIGPFFHDDPHPEKSLFFLLLNLNKQGITLTLETPTGAAIFKELVRKADVVVESFQPGYLASLGLDYESLEKVNPRVVMTSITPFGQTGPYSQYKGEEIVEYAMAGIMSPSGTSDREPLKHGGFQAQYEAGLNGALSTVFTILLRDTTSEGQHVDVSIREVVASTMVHHQPYYSWTGAVRGRRRPVGTMFRNIMPCKDGYFISQPGGGATWDQIAEFYGVEELKEPRFADAEQRAANGEELDGIIIEAVKDRTRAEMFKTASEKYRMLLGISQTPEDLANCPQLEARNFYQEVDHPVIGRTKVPFRLFNMTETPSRYRMPAPLLGQHNEEVYTQTLNYTKEDLVRLRALGII
jgi:crotonobetainyl-CoA:carnitine CoA-transferase CaiB-like acyl-CoA transferase